MMVKNFHSVPLGETKVSLKYYSESESLKRSPETITKKERWMKLYSTLSNVLVLEPSIYHSMR